MAIACGALYLALLPSPAQAYLVPLLGAGESILALLGIIVAGFGTIAYAVIHSARKLKRLVTGSKPAEAAEIVTEVPFEGENPTVKTLRDEQIDVISQADSSERS